MNGEIDLVRNSALQKNFMKTSCRSALQNQDHLTASDLSLFSVAVSRMPEAVRSDLDHLSDIGIISGSASNETVENTRKDREMTRNPPNNSGIVLPPVSCQACQVSTSLTEVSDSLSVAPQIASSGLNNSEELNRNHFLSLIKSNSEHSDKSTTSDVVDFTKTACGHFDGQLQPGESEYRNKLSKTHNLTSMADHLTDTTCLRTSNPSADIRFLRASLEANMNSDSLSRIHQRNDTKSISAEQEVIDISGEFGSSSLWSHQNCAGVTSTDHAFSFVDDTMTSLISNTEVDQDSTLNDGYANSICQTTGLNNSATVVTAKRPITGGHQATRYPIVNKGGLWPNSSGGIPNSTLGYLVSNAWSANSTSVSSKLGNALITDSNLSATDFQGNGANTSWSQNANVHQTLQKQSIQNVPNMAGAMSFMNGITNGTSLNRTPGCLSLGSIPTTNIGITSNNNKINDTGLSNIYSMFPKRPQHRMMAHWQQQQQHHHPTSQHQVPIGKSLMNIASSNLQLNGSRGSTSGAGSNISLMANGCGDNGLSSTTGGFNSNSVLQSLNNVVPSSSVNSPLVICSSGDSYANTLTFNTSTSESSLDSFKYGLDQQLMEVIKSFEMSSIGGNNMITSNANSTSVGGIDDLALPAGFGEMEQQIPPMNSMNQVPILGPSSMHNSAPMMSGSNNHSSNFGGLSGYNGGSMLSSIGMTSPYSMFANIFTREEGYSRKVFVGGLPPDIDEEEITTAFRRFGPLIVDWPHKTESKAYFPPKGYCFLLFQDERSVQSLISACIVDEGKYYWCVSSPTMKDKPVQIRPWNLADSDFVMDGSQPLDPRKTIFVGGVPRPLRAIELALIMDRLYGGVCYAGIDTDPELKYPKGAGRVAFSNQQSYIAAISARFVQLQHNEIDKRVEVKPYVLDNQMCDECQGTRCGGKFAPFFCANVTCLQYYCEQCWVQIHSRYGREYHKPLVKEGAERPRPALYRW